MCERLQGLQDSVKTAATCHVNMATSEIFYEQLYVFIIYVLLPDLSVFQGDAVKSLRGQGFKDFVIGL